MKTSQYLSKLTNMAQNYDFPLEEIESVESIQEWCKKRGIEENNPFRTGKCLRNRETGKYRILLAEEITQEMQNSVLGAMKMHGYGNKVDVLNDQFSFLAHLLLHEVAHATNESWSEQECDDWAFKELEKNAI